MTTYIVRVIEEVLYEVEAETPEEAREQYENGEVEWIENLDTEFIEAWPSEDTHLSAADALELKYMGANPAPKISSQVICK